MPRLHILRPGRFQDCRGREVNFTARELEQIARDYKPHSAPLIVGHAPSTKDPAHGWAASLSADDRGLHAHVPRVTPEMKAANREGRYRRCSSRLVREASGWRLDHIGMLGARTPAVSGLDPVELAGELDPEDVVITEVELAAPSAGGTTQDIEELIGPQSVTARAVAWARELVLGTKEPSTQASLAAEGDEMTNSQPAASRQGDNELKAELAAEREARKALETQVQELVLGQRRSNASTAVKAAVEAGRLLPRDEAPMTAVLAALADVTTDGEAFTVELAAESADGAARELSGAEYLGDLLGRLPVQVPQGELAGPMSGEMPQRPSPAPANTAVDRQRLKLHQRAVSLAAEKEIEYSDAVVAAAIELAGSVS